MVTRNKLYEILYLVENDKKELAIAQLKMAIDRINHNMTHCAVCLNKLTDDEFARIQPSDFQIVCDNHIRFRNVMQLDVAMKKENL